MAWFGVGVMVFYLEPLFQLSKPMTSTRLRLAIFLVLAVMNASVLAQQDYTIQFKTGSILYPERFQPEGTLADQIPAQAPVNGRHYAWLQFSNQLNTAQHDQLQQADIRILGYVRPHAYLASFPAGVQGNPLRSLPVRGLYPIQPEQKISPVLQEEMVTASGQTKVRVIWQYMQDLPVDVVARMIQEEGFQVIEWQPAVQSAVLLTTMERLPHLALLPASKYLEIWTPDGEPEDQYGRALHRSSLINHPAGVQGLQFDGSGVSLMVRDDGRIGPHIDFQGRLNQDYCYDPELPGTHGDMVSGIAAGAGNLDPFVQGMASGAMLFTEDYQANFLGQTMDIVNDEGVVITNSSYSDGCNNGYTNRARTVDRQIWENTQLMHVFSAGNAGTSNCDYGAGPMWGNITGGHKSGKNCIATANLFNDYSLVTSSSRGPVADGRIKPDIAAHGQNQLSTYPNNTIDFGGGTSAAAPGIAGIMAQLYQAYKEKHNVDNPPSGLIKGAMLTTATDLGKPGPDFLYGWGHVNAWHAYRLLDEERHMSIALSPGQETVVDLDIPEGISEARIMIYWPDPPAETFAAKALINDFDLRVTPPGSADELLPLVLDATPDPALLNLPAVPGEDHLNNMEQVRLYDPESGTYSIRITGHDLPFGEAMCYLFYDFRDIEPILAYPIGGESFTPGEQTRIYWEALDSPDSWEVDYSLDSGMTWIPYAAGVAPQARFINFTMPDTVSNQAMVRVSRAGETAQMKTPFHLLTPPVNIEVVKACPDSITYRWIAPDTISQYELFGLGQEYMEIVGQTDTAQITIPVLNPLADNWIAVRSMREGPIYSERTRAVNYNSGLKECKQELDMRPGQVISPSVFAIKSCAPEELDIILSVRNDGQQAVVDVPILYQLGQEPPVEDVISGTVNAGGSKFFKFDQPPFFTETGSIPLKIWTELPGDSFRFNDTLDLIIEATILNSGVLTPDATEDFEVGVLPQNWTITDPDGEAEWLILELPYENDDSTWVALFPNFFVPLVGERDILTSPKINLSNAVEPELRFDLAYGGLVGDGPDTLMIEVSTDCGNTVDQVIYLKTGTDLITAPSPGSISDVWAPESPDQWREEVVDLSPYKGQDIVLNFVNICGYGNILILDNIQIVDAGGGLLQAGFSLANDTVCVDEVFSVFDESLGSPSTYAWSFGESAIPATADSPGPHSIHYAQSGWKTMSLIIGNGLSLDTFSQMIYVEPKPVAAFDWDWQNDTLFFNNQSTGATLYSWSWENLGTSTEPSPFVIVPSGTSFTAQLIAEGPCGQDTLDVLIEPSSTVDPDAGEIFLQAQPNPFRGALTLSGSVPRGWLDLEILDMRGVIVWQSRQWEANASANWQRTVELPEGPSGTYILRARTDRGYQVLTLYRD